MPNISIIPSLRQFLLCVILVYSALGRLSPIAAQHPADNSLIAVLAIDLNKPASERKHHIAGLFLIGIGLSSICSKRYKSLAWLQWVPPILFTGAGLFLAAWSDDEIWPRGHLSWLWLLHNDAEARQHKLYALLLIILGGIEYTQMKSGARRKWLAFVFPVLAIAGGASLFFHQHGAPMAPEPNASEFALFSPARTTGDPHAEHTIHGAASHHQHDKAPPRGVQPLSLQGGNGAALPPGHTHSHPDEKVQRQHMWFAIVGFCVAAFKFLHDIGRPALRFRAYLWGSSVILLGLLLILYVE